MALTRQKSKPFTFQSTPRTDDSQYFRREMERVLEYIDQQFNLLSSSDAVDSGIIPTSRGGLGANFSQIPTFGIPYATQPGKFGWKVSNAFSIGLLGNSTAASWRDALGVSSFDNISSGTVLGRYSSGSGQPEAATLGAGLLFSGSSLVVSQPLQDFANIIPADGDTLRFFGSSWINQNLGNFWTDLVAEPELANYDYVELPFTFADDKRLLGRDGAAATEISIGSALVLSGGVLNTGPQLAAIEALTTTSYGIGLLEMVDDAALRSYAGLGTSAVLDSGVALGTATLDAGGKVPLSQIPDSVLGQVEYQGSWNASTNTPTLSTTPGAASKGFYYVTSVAGTFDGIDYDVGDWIISNGVIWEKVDNTDAVVSVAGRIGAITLLQADISGLTTADTPVFTSARFSGLTTDGILRTTSGNGTLAVSSFLSTALGGTGFTTYSEGDLLYGTAGGSLAKLASPFLPGYVLAASAGVPSWEQLSTLTATTITGTANQVLVNGTSGSGQTGPVTLTGPQDLHTGATPQFAGALFTGDILTGQTPWLGRSGPTGRKSLYIQNDGGGSPGIFIRSNSAAPSQCIIEGDCSRGTLASPTASQVSDGLLFLGYFYDGTTWQQGIREEFFAAENQSSTNQGTSMSWQTTLIGTTVASGRAERLKISGLGSIELGAKAALATNATDGFVYIPTCSGTPTGAPTAVTGLAPLVVDTTNNKLYFYSGGAWRDAGP